MTSEQTTLLYPLIPKRIGGFIVLNNVILIGHVVNDLELNETSSGKTNSTLKLAVARSFKNTNGVFETDYITCRLWSGIAKSTVLNCKKGSMVAVKGRLQTRTFEDNENNKFSISEVIVERVNFLA